MPKINDSTESIISNYSDIIRNCEENDEILYPTIEVIYTGQKTPQTITNKMNGGSEAFERKIDSLRRSKNIEFINIKLFRSKEVNNHKPFQQTSFIEFFENDDSEPILRPAAQPLGNIDINSNTSNFNSRNQEDRLNKLENDLVKRELELTFSYQLKELQMQSEFEINTLKRQLEFINNENKDYRAKISELLTLLSEYETDLNNLRGRHSLLAKEADKMESMGMSGFKDFDWLKAGGQIAVTGVSTAVQNILSDTFGLKGMESDGEQSQRVQEEPIEEETY